MAIVFSLVVIGLSALAWAGQALSWVSPGVAERLGLTEAEAHLEPAFHADVRAEAAWDTFTLWVPIVAGVLLIAGTDAWAYFGLAGGAIYAYFAGRGVLARRAMRRRGFRIGTEQNVKSAYLFLAIWGVMGLALVITAVVELAS